MSARGLLYSTVTGLTYCRIAVVYDSIKQVSACPHTQYRVRSVCIGSR